MAVAEVGWSRADRAVAWVLRVREAPAREGEDDPGHQVVQLALLWAALRCLVRYVVVPFGLLFVGPTAGVALGISLLCDVVALGGIVLNLRRLWAVRHPTRWRYLALAVVAVVLGSLLLPRI